MDHHHPVAACRIVSLVPAATEIVAALGLEAALVGRSHECDEPSGVRGLPVLTAAGIQTGGSSREIHEAVAAACVSRPADATTCPSAGERARSPQPLFALDIDRLAALEPDLILTQSSCDVCAVPAADVETAVRRSGRTARILALTATNLGDLWRDILAVGAATDQSARAREVVARLRGRVASVTSRTHLFPERPKVALIEWLDPPMAAGNWVPEMVRLAGGLDVCGRGGDHSHWITWNEVAAADPDVLVLVPCGFGLERVRAEAISAPVYPHLVRLRAFTEGRCFAVDGHHLFNRPGPRLVDSLELLAEILHPGRFRFPATQVHAARLGPAPTTETPAPPRRLPTAAATSGPRASGLSSPR